MKTLLILATLTLTLQAEEPAEHKGNPVTNAIKKVFGKDDVAKPDPNALTPSQVATWNQVNQAIGSANAAVSEAKVRQIDANEARQQAEADRRATQQQVEAAIQRMRKDAKCENCIPEAKPDGSYVWKKPPTE